jgi:hypothetical protein
MTPKPAAHRDDSQIIMELLEALREIAKGAGPYSQDPHEHARNTIEAMKQLAKEAIAQAEGR